VAVPQTATWPLSGTDARFAGTTRLQLGLRLGGAKVAEAVGLVRQKTVVRHEGRQRRHGCSRTNLRRAFRQMPTAADLEPERKACHHTQEGAAEPYAAPANPKAPAFALDRISQRKRGGN